MTDKDSKTNKSRGNYVLSASYSLLLLLLLLL